MTTPQDPGGDSPQDPSDPQNPYGPPPPDPAAPPAGPTPVYGDQPAAPAVPPAPSPYGQPPAPAYPQQPPPVGYGPPVPGQQPYPVGTEPEPSKGLAIGALITSFLGCTCVGALAAIVMSIVVLRRGKDGRNHGKGMAIAALIISVLSLLVGIALAALIAYAASVPTVDDLKTGKCFNADGLVGSSSANLSDIDVVSCSDSHDAEVFATGTLTDDQVDSFDSTLCDDDAGAMAEVFVPPLTYNALADADAGSGDRYACYAYNEDGTSLKGKIGS